MCIDENNYVSLHHHKMHVPLWAFEYMRATYCGICGVILNPRMAVNNNEQLIII